MFSCAFSAALSDSHICYVLDGILFTYGLILTALYCRLKVCMLHIRLYKKHQMYITNDVYAKTESLLIGNEHYIFHCLTKDKL